MALDGGNANIGVGTGAKSINMGVSLTSMTWLKAYYQNTGYKSFRGFSYTGTTYQYCFPDGDTTPFVVGKFIQIRNSSGTIVIEGTFTGFSGNNITLNITTNTSASPLSVLFEWGN